MLAVFIVIELYIKPYRDTSDKKASLFSFVCLETLAFTLQYHADGYDNSARGVLMLFTFVPSVLLLMWLVIRTILQVVVDWQIKESEGTLSSWEKPLLHWLAPRVQKISNLVRQYSSKNGLTTSNGTEPGATHNNNNNNNNNNSVELDDLSRDGDQESKEASEPKVVEKEGVLSESPVSVAPV